MTEGRLTDPAQRQGRQGDSHLAGREPGVEPVAHRQGLRGAGLAALDQRLELGGSHFDQGEFDRHEKGVEQHEDQRET